VTNGLKCDTLKLTDAVPSTAFRAGSELAEAPFGRVYPERSRMGSGQARNRVEGVAEGLTHLLGECYARLVLRSVPPKAGLLRRVEYERTSMKGRNK
jgi:hypothetical protein